MNHEKLKLPGYFGGYVFQTISAVGWETQVFMKARLIRSMMTEKY